MTDISELQQQLILLCDQLRKEQQEKCEALARIEILELQIHDMRESENKLLESLHSQTNQLEQTRISLEDSKLMIQSLQTELKHANESENNIKKAMDDLAIALKEATIESNRAKKSYFQTQSELEKLQVETDKLQAEAEESYIAWRAKEKGFLRCINVSEEELCHVKKENKRLLDFKKAAREEIYNLKDLLGQAVKEHDEVKESLEGMRKENIRLKNMLKDKRNGVSSSNEEVDSVKNDKPIVKYPSENWSLRWNSIRDSKLLEGSIFDMLAPKSPERENHDNYGYNLENCDDDSPTRLKKKKQGLRKIGQMLKMRSFNIKG